MFLLIFVPQTYTYIPIIPITIIRLAASMLTILFFVRDYLINEIDFNTGSNVLRPDFFFLVLGGGEGGLVFK